MTDSEEKYYWDLRSERGNDFALQLEIYWQKMEGKRLAMVEHLKQLSTKSHILHSLVPTMHDKNNFHIYFVYSANGITQI